MPWPLPPRAYQADPTGSQAVHGVRVVTGRPAGVDSGRHPCHLPRACSKSSRTWPATSSPGARTAISARATWMTRVMQPACTARSPGCSASRRSSASTRSRRKVSARSRSTHPVCLSGPAGRPPRTHRPASGHRHTMATDGTVPDPFSRPTRTGVPDPGDVPPAIAATGTTPACCPGLTARCVRRRAAREAPFTNQRRRLVRCAHQHVNPPGRLIRSSDD